MATSIIPTPRLARLLGAAAASAALACVAGPVVARAAPLTPQERSVALVDRLTWGETPQARAEFERLGYQAWLKGQLHPGRTDGLPPEIAAEIAGFTLASTPIDQLVREAHERARAARSEKDPVMRAAAQKAYQQWLGEVNRQSAARSLLRDIYSQNQLQSQLTWFWFNHFNVHAQKRDIRAMVADYEEHAIGDHALGRFRDLLEATLKHPAMLRYLDNDQNAAGKINENYAREIMELHTMGVGSGYTQKDVQELARILTGVGVSLAPEPPRLRPATAALYIRDGMFEFNPNRHDFGDKVFLGHTIRGTGFSEVEQALDILARQPATERHVSQQLAVYFLGDTPPTSTVDAMVKTWSRTDGDIAQVLETLFRSAPFEASLKSKFKDPIHFEVSAARLAWSEQPIINPQPMLGWLYRMSEPLFGHETPDGYPMSTAAWNGPGQLAVRFETARQIASGAPGLFAPPPAAGFSPMSPMGGPTAMPPPMVVANRPLPLRLQARVAASGLESTLSPQTQATLAKAISPADWNTLFLSSPEFMRR